MQQIKKINAFWAFIAIILGWTLFKHFNFTTFTFAKLYFDIVYLVVFVLSIYFLIKEYKKQPKQ